MPKGRTALPIWTKLVLALLILISLASSVCVLYLNIQHSAAEEKSALPSFNGCRYLAVTDGRFGEKYAAGSLLLVQPQASYQPGDEVIAANRSVAEPKLILNDRYLLLQLQSVDRLRATGQFIGMPEREPLSFPRYEIVGSVTHIVPVLGGVYDLMLGAPGYLLFLLLPLVLTIFWSILMANLSARRRADPERYGVSPEDEMAPPPESLFVDEPKPEPEEEPIPPVPSPDARFDLFEEEPAELEYLRVSVPYAEEEPALSEAAPVQEEAVELAPPPEPAVEPVRTTSPFMDPLAKRDARRAAASLPSGPERCPAPVELPPEPPTPAYAPPLPPVYEPALPEELPPPEVPQPSAPCAEASPSPLPETDEAVAIYSGKEDAADFAPDYLDQEISGSLAELKASLRENRRPSHVVDIVVGDRAAALDEDKLRRLEKINAFDPDKAIAEIKRKNALFMQGLASGGPFAREDDPAEPLPAPEPPAYPSRAAEEFYRIQPARRGSGEKRPASFLHVVGEEPSSRYHNRNEEERG